MSFRLGLLPILRCAPRTAAPSPSRAFHYLAQQPGTGANAMRSMAARQPKAIAMARALPRTQSTGTGTGTRVALALGLGLAGLSLASPANLDAPAPGPNDFVSREAIIVNERVDPPQSIVSVPQLTFGAACGICAGVFVKKGFKLVAFFLGGVFVLLQYLSSRSWVTVDWTAVSKAYDGAIGTVDAAGRVSYPTPTGIINGLIDFLTANFQQRATFVAGFILGLRIG